jgi:hypothetical protein
VKETGKREKKRERESKDDAVHAQRLSMSAIAETLAALEKSEKIT